MDIDTTPPASHHDGRPSMQLDIPSSDEVMMEVEPDFSVSSTPVNPSVEIIHASSGLSPNTMQIRPLSGLSGLVHSTSSRTVLEGGSPALRPLPAPPVVLVSGSDVPAWPKFKLDQLFVEWLARIESRQWLDGLLEDARCGKAPELLVAEQSSRVSRMDRAVSPGPSRSSPATAPSSLGVSSQQAPGSPVSRLFNNHVPFGDSDSSPRSPPSAPIPGVSQSKPALGIPIAADFDLGRSGTASPMGGNQATVRDILPAPAVKASQHQLAPALIGSGATLKDGIAGSRHQEQVAPGSGSPITPSDSVTRLEQVPDSKVLDRVADGIAGMTAAVDGVPSVLAMKVDQSASGDVVEGDSRQSETSIPGPGQRSRGRPSQGVRGAMESIGRHAYTTSVATPSIVGQSSSAPDVTERRSVRTALASAPLATGYGVSVKDVAAEQKEISGGASPAGEGYGVSRPVRSHQELRSGTDSMVTESEAVTSMHDTRDQLLGAMLPPRAKLNASENTKMAESASKPRIRTTLPRFYFPCGKDADTRERREREGIKEFFKVQRMQKNLAGVNRTDIAELVVEVISLPSYFATIIFNAILEVFPLRSAEQGRSESNDFAQTATSSCADRVGGESSMKDVGHGEVAGPSRDRGEAPVSVSPADGGTTNSDTTMGDVAEASSGEKRANGYQTTAQIQGNRPGETSNQTMGMRDSSPSQGSASADLVTESQFLAYYNAFCAGSSKEGRLFSALREPHSKRNYLIPGDFKPLLRALLMCHQGLAFLHATPEFQQRYSETVIERIYFGCTRQHNGRLTLNDIRRSKLLDTLMVVDEEEDINRERKYFSYEHFYVLYCRFWELDANHDLQIDREDLMRYGSHSLTYRIVDRIFGGFARPLDCPENPGFMSYTDFIWFCLSEEDKTSDTAIDYWFRCVDMDGDGLITMYDMEFFYKEQLHRMECFGHEPVQIRDILCQLLDMIKPNMQPPVIRRRDLKRCRLAGNFFNVLFNLNKFFAIEARDPLQIRQEHATPELTDWDRFAALEYLRLSAEEEGEEDESWEDVGDATNPLMSGEAPF